MGAGRSPVRLARVIAPPATVTLAPRPSGSGWRSERRPARRRRTRFGMPSRCGAPAHPDNSSRRCNTAMAPLEQPGDAGPVPPVTAVAFPWGLPGAAGSVLEREVGAADPADAGTGSRKFLRMPGAFWRPVVPRRDHLAVADDDATHFARKAGGAQGGGEGQDHGVGCLIRSALLLRR